MRKLKLAELGRLSTDEFKASKKLPCAIVLDNVRSMHNVGSVFRTSDAFRMEKIYLCGITGTPPHREISKTAIGADKSVDWEYFEQTKAAVQKLLAENYTVYAIEQVVDSVSLKSVNWPQGKVAFVFGNEIDGISQEVLEICNQCIEIPQLGTKHSLNVSVSAGIILWDYTKNYLQQQDF